MSYDDEVHDFARRYEAIVALLPVCPSCGGTKKAKVSIPVRPTEADPRSVIEMDGPCPENDGHCDGRVTVERMAKVWEAVHDDEWDVNQPNGVIKFLRAVRPVSPQDGSLR